MAWNCNESSVAPITDYINNPIFQEPPDEDAYYSVTSDERMYLDLRATSRYVKEAKKLERNDSKINLHIMLKRKKILGILSGEILIYFNKEQTYSQA